MEDKTMFHYFVDQTNNRLDSIEKKIDTLITFRMMLIGASLAVSAIVSLTVTIMFNRG